MSHEGREPHLDAFRSLFAGTAGTAGTAGSPPPAASPPAAPPPGPALPPRPGLPSGWRDTAALWLDALRDDPRARAAGLAVLALVAGLLWYRVGLAGAGAPPDPAPPPGAAGQPAPGSAGGPPTGAATGPGGHGGAAGEDGPVHVHVAGAVRAPGLYRLRPGARVADALKAAGGAVPDADTDRLNLAAPVGDGEQVFVPTVGEPLPPGADPAAAGPPGPPGPGGVAGPTGSPGARTVVDVNTATAADLEALPGVGPVIAAAIVDERARAGPFASVDDLLRVTGIGEARLEELRPHVTV